MPRFLATLVLLIGTPLFADSVIFSGSGKNTTDNIAISYSAEFEMTTVSGQPALEIILTNTSTANVLSPGEVLTGLYFAVSGGTTLTPYSASLGSGSTVKQGGVTVSNPSPVGENWQYKSGSFSGSGVSGDNEGLGASGVGGNFGPSGNFCSSGCQNLGGADYGLVPSSPYYPGNENGGLSNIQVIQNTVSFVLTGVAANFNPYTGITKVVAQYGTSTTEPQVAASQTVDIPVSTPEPASLALLASGLALLLWSRRFRLRLASIKR